MLSLEQFLLTKLMEECDEVSQRAAKQIQFGRDQDQASDYEFFGGTQKPITSEMKLPNLERLKSEVLDLTAILCLLTDAGELPYITHQEMADARDAKRAKLKKYLTLSIHQGKVDPDAIKFFN